MADRSGAASAASSSSAPDSSLPPLPPGWTENKAPTGHTYYYNAQTRESTYKRPAPPPPSVPPPPRGPPGPPAGPPRTHQQPPPAYPAQPFASQPVPLGHGPQAPAPFLRLSDPRVANAFMAQQQAATNPDHGGRGGRGGFGGRGGRGGRGSGRGGADGGHPRHQPTDKPRSRIAIPGHEPWSLVYTKLGRRFVHNVDKKTSFWRIPEKLMPAILELDKASIQQKVEAAMKAKGGETEKTQKAEGGTLDSATAPQEDELGSEYEEVEVTDDEGEGDADGDDRRRKRQRTEEAQGDEEDYVVYDEPNGDDVGGGGPVEFGEDDIAFQLQAYGNEEDYGAWEGEEGEGEGDDDGDEEGGQDGPALFRAMLDDFKINPFSPWEKLIEEGKVFDDPRYTALPNMRARREVWEAWSRDGIAAKKAERETQKEHEAATAAAKDPRASYLQLLQDHATPKLYWPEFKRKYRKHPALKDAQPPQREKDKEKLYRDYVARRKLPAATRKADLTALLGALPRNVLNNQTRPTQLPLELTGDLRYVAMEPQTRDELVEAFLKTAGPPPA